MAKVSSISKLTVMLASRREIAIFCKPNSHCGCCVLICLFSIRVTTLLLIIIQVYLTHTPLTTMNQSCHKLSSVDKSYPDIPLFLGVKRTDRGDDSNGSL